MLSCRGISASRSSDAYLTHSLTIPLFFIGVSSIHAGATFILFNFIFLSRSGKVDVLCMLNRRTALFQTQGQLACCLPRYLSVAEFSLAPRLTCRLPSFYDLESLRWPQDASLMSMGTVHNLNRRLRYTAGHDGITSGLAPRLNSWSRHAWRMKFSPPSCTAQSTTECVARD